MEEKPEQISRFWRWVYGLPILLPISLIVFIYGPNTPAAIAGVVLFILIPVILILIIAMWVTTIFLAITKKSNEAKKTLLYSLYLVALMVFCLPFLYQAMVIFAAPLV